MRKVLKVLSIIIIFLLVACDKKESIELNSYEPYKINWAYIGEDYPDTDKIEDEINKILLAKFNVTINLIPLSWKDAGQKIDRMLLSDEKLDLVPITFDKGDHYLNNGQVIDMKKLIDKYGYNIKKYIGEDNLNICNVNGKIYGTPVCKEYASQKGIMMRKDLLEESGFLTSDIRCIDDLSKVYARVKDKHPNMIMLAGKKGATPGVEAIFCDNLSDLFGVVMPNDNMGNIVNYYETKEFRHISDLMYEFANKGYISKDCATTNDTRQVQVRAGNAFSYFSSIKPGVDEQDTLDTGYEMIHSTFSDRFKSTKAITFICWGIGKNCRSPETVMQVLDYMYGSSEIMNLLNWGIEGVHYVIKNQDKGIIKFPQGVSVEDKRYGLNIGYEIPNQFIAYIWEGNDPSIWEEYKAFNNAKSLPSTGFVYDDSKVVKEVSALTTVRLQYIDAIGSGAVDPDIAIPSFIGALKKAGINTVINEKQKQLDNYKENNNNND